MFAKETKLSFPTVCIPHNYDNTIVHTIFNLIFCLIHHFGTAQEKMIMFYAVILEQSLSKVLTN